MKRILAIDDKDDNLTTIKAIIKSQMPDCEVLTALSGIDGVELAKSEQPDIILLDIIMPIIDGYETCKRLKTYELTKHIPVIMLTAIKTDMQSRVKALDLGADAFLSKPIDSIELIAQIKVMLRIKRAEDKLRAEKDLLEVIVFDRTKSLKESEQKYRTLYEFAPIPYQSLNEDGSIADINPAWLKLLGYKREDVIGQLYEDFVHPDDKVILKSNFPILVERGIVHEVSFRLRHKQGYYLDISLEGRSGYHPDGSFKNTYCIFQDITERKKAERKLRESEEFKNRLIDSSNDCIKVLDPEGNLIFMSAGGQRLLEIKDLSKYINKSWTDFWKGSDNKAAIEAISKAKKGEIGEFRGYCETASGKPKWWDVIVTPINDGQGNLNSLLAISRDVTKQKQDQEEIRKSEERYKNFITQVSEGVFRIELSEPMSTALPVEEQIDFMLDHIVLAECNQTYLQMFGYKNQDEILGKSPLAYLGGIAKANYREMLRHFITSGYRSENMEIAEQDSNGGLKYFSNNSVGIIENDHLVRVWGTQSDITKRKSTDKELLKLSNAMEQSPVSIVITDTNGTIEYVNPKTTEITGYTFKELIGGNPRILKSGEQNAELYKNLWSTISSGKKWVGEFHNKKKNGELFWEHASISPILNEKGEITNFLAVKEDITERKLSEKALKESLLNFQLIFENSPIGIYMAKKNGEIIDTNQTLLTILGSPSIEATKAINVLKFPPLVENSYADKFKRCVEKGITIEFEMDYKSKWGKLTTLHSFLVPLKDSDGQVSNVYTLIEDITERKRSERIQNILFKISNAVNSTESLEQLIAYIRKELGTIIDTTNFYLALYDEKTNSLTLPFFADKYDNYTKLPAEKTITRYVIETKTSLLADLSDLEKLEQEGLIARHGADSLIWLGVPLKVEGEVIGVLAVQSYTDKNAYGESDKKMLEFISDQISVAIYRKKADELINKSEKRFNLAMRASNDGLYDWDFLTDEVYYSSRWKNMLGYSDEELPNELSVWKKLSHPQERDLSLDSLQEAVKKKVERYNVEFRMKHKLGHWVNILSRALIIYDEEGRAIRAVGTHSDLTEDKKAAQDLKEAKEKAEESEWQLRLKNEELNNKNTFIQTILDKLPIGLALNKIDGGDATYMNKKFEEIYGWTTKEINSIASFFEKVYPDEKYRNQLMERVMADINSGDPNRLHWENIFITRKDGSKGVVNSVNISLKEQNTMVSTVMDITDLYQIQNDLVKAKEKAEESDRLKSAFLANMSHEIRTPMNGILGFTSLLKEPDLTSDEKDSYIKIIEKSGARMLTTINDIVDISKIEAGQMEINYSDFSLNKQIEFLYSFFKPETDKKGIKLSFHTALANNEDRIHSDLVKVNAIYTNLIKNAIKYSHKGSIEFGYQIEESDRIPMIQFYVKDCGIGIPKERQEAIFERFVQADIEDKQVYEGSGLGLAISKAYAEMLGGKIWLESKEKQGSQFYFSIPYRKENKTIQNEQDLITDASIVEEKRKLHILIAEDDLTSGIYLNTLLKNLAKEIHIVKTGKEAVEACKKNKDIDLILMDIKMPGMSGYEATRQIRTFNKNIVIIAQTAYALSGDRKLAIDAGCNEYITKPINKKGLLELLWKHFK